MANLVVVRVTGGPAEQIISVTGARGRPGPAGPPGPQGAQGPPGVNPPYALTALLVAGTLQTVTNALPPGVRVPYGITLTTYSARVGTAPVGGPISVDLLRNGTVVATATIAAGATSGQVTGLSIALTAGQILTWNITAVGTTTPGAALAVDLLGMVA